MGKTNSKIRRGYKIRKFRKRHSITICKCCGRRLFKACHHFLCNTCWTIKAKKPLEWKHYYKVTHEKYYKQNCKKYKGVNDE